MYVSCIIKNVWNDIKISEHKDIKFLSNSLRREISIKLK